MSDDEEAPAAPHVSPFESIRKTTEFGGKYWSARDLARILGYTKWEKFKNAIQRAEEACQQSGQPVKDHFLQAGKMIDLGKGAKREIEDVHFSRYGAYLLVQNADPSKPIVALGQTYFAVQTRRQEKADELADLTEDQRRLYLRNQLTDHNRQLADTASQAGVIKAIDFAIFQDHGYMGLYGGLKSGDIHIRKGLKKNQRILDHMGSEELAANLFRATQTAAKLRRDKTTGKEKANRTHYEVGKKVRQTIEELGGTMPEELPTPQESIQQLQKKEKKQLQQDSQFSMFDGQPEP